MITKEDILAAMDVVDKLGEESDQLPLVDALSLNEALGLLHAVVRRTQSLVQTQAMRQLEQPKVVDGKRWRRKTKYTKRFRHAKIAGLVVDRARMNVETGEILDATTSARNAARMMLQIYCSDSTSAKQNEMKRLLGIGDPVDEGFAYMEQTGSELESVDLRESDVPPQA